MINVANTKICANNQTTIPSVIRKKFNITKDTIVGWDIDSDGRVILTFKEEMPKIHDLAALGKGNERTNALDLKRTLYQ
ncbi:hypothetical protein [Methanobrevibacter sp.]|uniref:hypothetical protein n=1 Tax=Methanobrevibacter sp. TaxID=66852 RepID=UPI00388D45AD